jgi:hypothetical protein
MTLRAIGFAALLAAICVPRQVRAQIAPATRALGPILARSTEPLAAVSQVRELSDGRLIVHDNRGRRVALFDSTLKFLTSIADTTHSTDRAYGSRIGGLIAARGDTSYFVDPASVSILVVTGAGKIVRTIAAPSQSAATSMIGGPFGTPATDPSGRVVYRGIIDPSLARAPSVAAWVQSLPDSSLIVRANVHTRAIDTIAKFRIPRTTGCCVTDPESGRQVSATFVNPIPWTDDWAMLADGSVAIVRGQEYRVEIISPNGSIIRGPKLPFEWEHLSDADKKTLFDSTRAAVARSRPDMVPSTNPGSTTLVATRQATTRDLDGRTLVSLPDFNSNRLETALLLDFVAPNDLPDYRPAFRQGAARGDTDGRLWIRTTKNVGGGSVYDVVSNKGELIERVAVPPGRFIAGFGAGVVYMGVLDGDVARVERARIR